MYIYLLTRKDGEVFSDDPYKSEVISYAVKKQVTPDFRMIFLRGIGCNWLVSVACFMGLQGRDVASKLMGIWWPIFGFVSLGFDHVVANMTFIPMAIWVGAPEISIGLYIWKGIIPALIGNIVGGAVFCSKSSPGYVRVDISLTGQASTIGTCTSSKESQWHSGERAVEIRRRSKMKPDPRTISKHEPVLLLKINA